MDASTIVTAIGVIVSAIAVVVSAIAVMKQIASAERLHGQQTALTEKLNREQQAFTEKTNKEQRDFAEAMHREQLMLSQRQLFLEIWPKMEALNAIDVSAPIAPDVVRTVNVLELVALCWEGGMVDSGVIRRSFGTRYVELYETIQKVPNLKNPNLSGTDMLRANPATGKLYDQLRKELQEHLALRPVGA